MVDESSMDYDTPQLNGEIDDVNMEPTVPLTDEQKFKLAEGKRLEGNHFYKQKSYKEAYGLYTEAIDHCPNCAAFYGNRSAASMMLNKYMDALEDARKSTRIDNGFIKGHLREGKCHLLLGNPTASIHSYQEALRLEPKSKEATNEIEMATCVIKFEKEANCCFSKGDHRKALFCIERCSEFSPACVKFKVQKAEALAMLKRYQESQDVANDIIRSDGMNADAIYVRGLCLYYQDNVDKAFQHFQQVLRFAPDHPKALAVYKKARSLKSTKEDGNNKFRAGAYQEAYDLYTKALGIDPENASTNSKLYFNRATVSSKLKKIEQAIEDCSEAIKLDEGYMKAYMRRAKCYMDTEKYEESVRDYEKIYQLDQNQENKRSLMEAKKELKKSKRKDYYKLLGVTKFATEEEIKKAYKKRALSHHPDRHAHDTVETQKEEEIKFKECGEAYTVLSDSTKKMRYDSGHDLEDLDGHGFADIDPSTIFQAFFGGGNPFGGGFGQGGGSTHHQFHGGFPNEGGFGRNHSFNFQF